MGTEPTQRDIYDRVSEVDIKIERLIARVDERLDNGSKRMGDHEARIRLLEQAKWKAAGAAGSIGALAGGGAGSLLSYLLARHP